MVVYQHVEFRPVTSYDITLSPTQTTYDAFAAVTFDIRDFQYFCLDVFKVVCCRFIVFMKGTVPVASKTSVKSCSRKQNVSLYSLQNDN